MSKTITIPAPAFKVGDLLQMGNPNSIYQFKIGSVLYDGLSRYWIYGGQYLKDGLFYKNATVDERLLYLDGTVINKKDGT